MITDADTPWNKELSNYTTTQLTVPLSNAQVATAVLMVPSNASETCWHAPCEFDVGLAANAIAYWRQRTRRVSAFTIVAVIVWRTCCSVVRMLVLH